ncbi:MAG: HupE/UreJ family protein [Bacteroidetes bacterium]|nr:HupE/UreJ family protein [Bacteroidota bacterium]
MIRKILLIGSLLSIIHTVMGHPMPHSILSFDVKSDKIYADLKIPIKELQFAVPFDVSEHTETLLNTERRNQLEGYFLAHIHARSHDGHDWKISLIEATLGETEQIATGKYQELILRLLMQPPKGGSVRRFDLFYDAIVHQVVTHKIFVTIKQDWQSGRIDTLEKHLGLIELSFADNTILPLSVSLDEGNNWKGFLAMVRLGIRHITEGVDHLLFLLVLLLPATLIPFNNRWTAFSGTRNSIVNIFKIVTAFTIGHSLSLIFGALHWISLPSQPVEIFIAFTVLIAAIHALRPIFFEREIYIASIFGLVHGLAFSTVLSELHLETVEMIYSILGFNIGIELMQLFIIFLTIPWLIILSKNKHYQYLRVVGAIFAIIVSLAWMIERITLEPNRVSIFAEQIFSQGDWILLLLMSCAIFSIAYKKVSNKQ